MAALTKHAISVTVRDRAKRTKSWDHKGYKSQIRNIFKKRLIKAKYTWRSLVNFNFLNFMFGIMALQLLFKLTKFFIYNAFIKSYI